MTTVGPFTKMDFRSLTNHCTKLDKEFVREILNSKSNSVLVVTLDKPDGTPLGTRIIPTDASLQESYQKLVADATADDSVRDDVDRRLKDAFSGDFKPDIVDPKAFALAFMTAMYAVKENTEYSEFTTVAALVGKNFTKERFTDFMKDGRPPKQNKVPGADFGMAWSLFDYFEKIAQYQPRAIYLRVQSGERGSRQRSQIKALGYYSLVDEAKVKADVNDALARVFNM